jgi:23S rRNA (guanosine2251-2'-O)-methyltransferase
MPGPVGRGMFLRGGDVKTEFLYGIHPVSESIRAGRRKILELFVTRRGRSQRLESLAARATTANLPVHRVSDEKLNAMAGGDAHQGVTARVATCPTVGIEAIGQGAASPFVIILDSILDPQNFGAVVRTALCAGVHGMVIAKDRAAPPSPAVSRASAGALEHMPLARVTNLVAAIERLKADGLWIAGLAPEAEQSVYATDLATPLGIVIGGEQKGIRPLVRKHCDHLVAIPQHGPLDSLNASVAGAVVIYEALRQRRAAGL